MSRRFRRDKRDGERACISMEPSVVDVVEACRRGDRAAQRLLYDQSHQSVYRLMVRMVGEQDAEDLTQFKLEINLDIV